MESEHQTQTATFAVALSPPSGDPDLDGFNEFGVRENVSEDGDLDSIDVIFNAMEPGIRKDIEVTPQFLARIAEKYSDPLPALLDHSHEQLSQVGTITAVKFADYSNKLRLMLNIPNTGNSVKADVISDFTHTPPAITDGSVGFNPKTLKFAEAESDDALAQFDDGELIEFSFTPFPAGYDDGGLSPVFSDAVDSFVESVSHPESTESQLIVNDSKLTRSN